jgi:hypothetical protein
LFDPRAKIGIKKIVECFEIISEESSKPFNELSNSKSQVIKICGIKN